MGSVLVIVLPPCTDDLPGMTIAGEQMFIETLVSLPLKLSTKPFCIAGPARCNASRRRDPVAILSIALLVSSVPLSLTTMQGSHDARQWHQVRGRRAGLRASYPRPRPGTPGYNRR